MKTLHIYDYDGVLTNPTKGYDHPDISALERIKKQLENENMIAISTGRNFAELERLEAVKALKLLAKQFNIDIPVITEKGMVIDIIKPDQTVITLPNIDKVKPMTNGEIAKASDIISKILEDDQFTLAKSVYEIELCKKRTFFSVILTPKEGVEIALSMRDVLERLNNVMWERDVLGQFERRDLHTEVTGKAIDLQTNGHIKSNGSEQLRAHLGKTIEGYMIIAYGDSPTDIDILSPFAESDFKTLHVHVGPEDKRPRHEKIKVIVPKAGVLYSDGLREIAIEPAESIKQPL